MCPEAQAESLIGVCVWGGGGENGNQLPNARDTTGKPLRHPTEQRNPVTKEHMLSNSIYIKFKIK